MDKEHRFLVVMLERHKLAYPKSSNFYVLEP